jgi:hypothetical protein
MATIIHFVGRDQVLVREDETEVQAAFVEAGGRPAALTHHRTGNQVFVNISQVTYWHSRGAREPGMLPWSTVSRVPTAT